MRISKITPVSDFKLFIESDLGQSGIFDLRPYLDLEAFRALKNPDEFLKIQNGHYFIAWGCGADLSADTIFANWEKTF